MKSVNIIQYYIDFITGNCVYLDYGCFIGRYIEYTNIYYNTMKM